MIVQVNSDFAVEMWPVLSPLFRRVTEATNGCYEPADILHDILNGKQALWVSWNDAAAEVEAAMTTSVVPYPRRKVCRVVFVAGKNMRRWLPEFIETVERYARDQGASAMEGAYRRGWARMWPKTRETGVNLFKDL